MMEHAQIRELVPHAHPMLLIDRAIVVDGDARIVTEKTVSGSEPCYSGLPTNAPQAALRYPPSLLMESWGQGAAILWVLRMRARGFDRTGALILASVHEVDFHCPVYPGDVLRHEIRIDRFLSDSIILGGESHVGDKLVTTVGSAIAFMRTPETVPGRTT